MRVIAVDRVLCLCRSKSCAQVTLLRTSLLSPMGGALFAGTGEIGVPPYFAMRLSFPERVTPHNVEQLRQVRLRRARCLCCVV